MKLFGTDYKNQSSSVSFNPDARQPEKIDTLVSNSDCADNRRLIKGYVITSLVLAILAISSLIGDHYLFKAYSATWVITSGTIIDTLLVTGVVGSGFFAWLLHTEE